MIIPQLVSSKFSNATNSDCARETLTDAQYKAVEALYNFSKENADVPRWGTGIGHASFNPKFFKISKRSLYSVFSDGKLSLNFDFLDDTSDAEKYRAAFKNKLSKIKVIAIPADYQEKFITLPIDKWGSIVNDFIGIIRDLIKE